MIDPELYIKEGLKIIDTLISQKNLPFALHACEELLKVNPYHRKVQKYLRKIQKRILEENAEKVQADIEATMHLWKEERYDDLMKIYIKLYQYAPQHKELERLLAKLNDKLSEQQKSQRRDFIQRALAAIADLLKEKRLGDTIQACEELLSVDPLNGEAKKILQRARQELVEQKLQEAQHFIDRFDTERALEFYESLLGIDPENTRVKNLAFQAKTHLAEKKLLAGKIHLNESIVRMEELFRDGEYEKVLQACEEIERLDPGNFPAKIFRKKAQHAIHNEIEYRILKELKEVWGKLQSVYEKSPELFVKI